MLRSDWSRLACLLRDLQLFMVGLEGLFEVSQLFVAYTHVCVRSALARLVACANGKFQQMSHAAI